MEFLDDVIVVITEVLKLRLGETMVGAELDNKKTDIGRVDTDGFELLAKPVDAVDAGDAVLGMKDFVFVVRSVSGAVAGDFTTMIKLVFEGIGADNFPPIDNGVVLHNDGRKHGVEILRMFLLEFKNVGFDIEILLFVLVVGLDETFFVFFAGGNGTLDHDLDGSMSVGVGLGDVGRVRIQRNGNFRRAGFETPSSGVGVDTGSGIFGFGFAARLRPRLGFRLRLNESVEVGKERSLDEFLGSL